MLFFSPSPSSSPSRSPSPTSSPRHLSYGFPKSSPYLPFFNYHLLRKTESGVLELLLRRHMSDACGEERSDDPSEVALGGKKLLGAFVWMAAGFAATGAILAAEVAVGRWKRRKKSTSHTSKEKEEEEMRTRLERRLAGVLPPLWKAEKRAEMLEAVERAWREEEEEDARRRRMEDGEGCQQ